MSSVDELKSRIAKLDKSVQADARRQLQKVFRIRRLARWPDDSGWSGSGLGHGTGQPIRLPPLQETFQRACGITTPQSTRLRAASFQDVLHYYPMDEPGRDGAVLPGRDCLQDAELCGCGKGLQCRAGGVSAGARRRRPRNCARGLALLQMNKKDAGIHELNC